MKLCCAGGGKKAGVDQWSDLSSAAYTGNVSRMMQQLNSGTSINTTDEVGCRYAEQQLRLPYCGLNDRAWRFQCWASEAVAVPELRLLLGSLSLEPSR